MRIFNEDKARELPSTQKSEEEMAPNVPKVMRLLEQNNASDLIPMLFGQAV